MCVLQNLREVPDADSRWAVFLFQTKANESMLVALFCVLSLTDVDDVSSSMALTLRSEGSDVWKTPTIRS